MAQGVMPGVPRISPSVPTSDAERRSIYDAAITWNPTHISVWGHDISVDLSTGNLLILTRDAQHTFYRAPLAVQRRYDAQEQHMQVSHIRETPNMDPELHWFGNWTIDYEARATSAWHETRSEIHISSGIVEGLFAAGGETLRPLPRGPMEFDALLRAHGIPRTTLQRLGWHHRSNDVLYRTLRGEFQLLAGRFEPRTLVDDSDIDLWLFRPITGDACRVSSRHYFSARRDNEREVGWPLLVTDIVDALGHSIELRPTTTSAPYNGYVLSHSGQPTFRFELGNARSWLDGSKPGGYVKQRVVTRVHDEVRNPQGGIFYEYTDSLLTRVVLPSPAGDRSFRYHYSDPTYSDILTAIENPNGARISFEYIEDDFDNDDRLRQRLKIRRITAPTGTKLEYSYSHAGLHASCTIFAADGTRSSATSFEFIRDIDDTQRRYNTSQETAVGMGYMLAPNESVIARTAATAQKVRYQTIYTTDGRYNPRVQIDPLGRRMRYEYNDFNLLVRSFDFDGREVRREYDLPLPASASSPRRYDLLKTRTESILRNRDSVGAFTAATTWIETTLTYATYDATTSPDTLDHGMQSTHRMASLVDEGGKTWALGYDDLANSAPPMPTSITSPLGNTTQYRYGVHGELIRFVDALGQETKYEYDSSLNLTNTLDPNGDRIQIVYETQVPWVRRIIDQVMADTVFVRDAYGHIRTVRDPCGDAIEYEYDTAGRVNRIVQHRASAPNTPADSSQPHFTVPFPNVSVTLSYGPLGELTGIANAAGARLSLEYDEVGRQTCWYLSPSRRTRFVHDAAGQVIAVSQRSNSVSKLSYTSAGFLRSKVAPDWQDDQGVHPGKVVTFSSFDHRGRPFTVNDSELGIEQLAYDSRGNLVTRVDPDGFALTFTFDDDGRLIGVVSDDGAFEAALQLDPLGRAVALADSGTGDGRLTWKYAYTRIVGAVTKGGNLYRRELPAAGLVTEVGDDAKHRLTNLTHRMAANAAPLLDSTVTYRLDDLVVAILGDDASTYLYDGLKQLLYESSSSMSCDYDATGNRLYRADLTTIPSPQQSQYDVENRLVTSSTGATFAYDVDGRMLSDGETGSFYYYDGEGRLRTIQTGGSTVRYVYDRGGRVIRRIEIASIATQWSFSYLVARPVVLRRDGQLVGLLTWDSTGELVRMRRLDIAHAGPLSNSYFPIYDCRGTIARLVTADAAVHAVLQHDAWGNRTVDNDPQKLTELLGYRNGLREPLTGCVQFGMRWYAPKLGRWLTEEPTEHSELGSWADSANLYRYALNNPVTLSDPTGLEAVGIEQWNPRPRDIVFPLWKLEQMNRTPAPPMPQSREEAELVLGFFGPIMAVAALPFLVMGLRFVGRGRSAALRTGGVSAGVGAGKAILSGEAHNLTLDSVFRDFSHGFAAGLLLGGFGKPGTAGAVYRFLNQRPGSTDLRLAVDIGYALVASDLAAIWVGKDPLVLPKP